MSVRTITNKEMQPVAHSQAGTEIDEQNLTRRNFLKLGIGALTALAALEVGSAGLLFLRSRSLDGEFGGEIKAGPVEQFPNGSVTEFTDSSFFLVRASNGGFLAIYRRCPHLGCTVNWVAEEEKFYCPCHASSFDFYGNYENQPVPRALDTFPINFKDGLVVVKTSEFQRRDRFTPEQLVYQ